MLLVVTCYLRQFSRSRVLELLCGLTFITWLLRSRPNCFCGVLTPVPPGKRSLFLLILNQICMFSVYSRQLSSLVHWK